LFYIGRRLSLLTLRKQNNMRMFENRVLRRIFGPKREEVARDWRKLHNEKFHSLYSNQEGSLWHLWEGCEMYTKF